jgi:hypothetical protein
MPPADKSWFAVTMPGTTTLCCCSCHNEIDLGFPSLDHHPAYCPSCGIESVFLSWKNVLLQVVPEKAPPEVTRALRWVQEELDEVEMVTLLASLGQLVDTVERETVLLRGK